MFNTKNRFGAVSIFLHWVTAAAIFGLFAVGWYMIDLSYYDSMSKVLLESHRSIGILLGLLLAFRLLWNAFNRRPDPVAGSTKLDGVMAKMAHYTMHLLMVLIVVSGYLISTAKGASISVFDWFEVPATLSGITNQEDIAGEIHKILAYAIIGLAALHTAAALKHHFIDKDETLRRMIGVRSRDS
jgi:cytochrome b561